MFVLSEYIYFISSYYILVEPFRRRSEVLVNYTCHLILSIKLKSNEIKNISLNSDF